MKQLRAGRGRTVDPHRHVRDLVQGLRRAVVVDDHVVVGRAGLGRASLAAVVPGRPELGVLEERGHAVEVAARRGGTRTRGSSAVISSVIAHRRSRDPGESERVAQPRTLPECTRVQPASSISYPGIVREDLLEAHAHLEPGRARRRGTRGCRDRSRRAAPPMTRSMSNSSGRSHTRSSRFAEPSSSSTFAPSGISLRRAARPGGSACAPSAASILRSAGSPRPRRGCGRDRPRPCARSVGKALEREQAVGEQLRGGLVARDDQEEAGSPPPARRRARRRPAPAAHSAVVRSSGACPGGDRGAALGDEVAEVLVEVRRGRDAGGRDVGNALVAVEQRVRPDPELLLVELPARRACARSRPSAAAPRSRRRGRPRPSRSARRESSCASARISGSRSATRRGVNARLTSAAQIGVIGRIGGEQHRQRVVLLERDAVARAVGVGIVQRGEHVVVARDRPEVERPRCGSRARGRAALGRPGTDRRGTRTSTD